jgi:hypothetical protein
MGNNNTLFLIFSFLLVFFYYVFTANPFYILNYARIPVMILCIIILFGVFIFIEYYTSKSNIFGGDTARELWTNFVKYAYKYAMYVLYFFCISLIGYVLFKSVEKGIVFTFDYSFFVTMGLVVLLLTLATSFMGPNSAEVQTINSPNVELIKTFILYIPCLITDAIEYIKKDYDNTPSTVFIVFLLLMVYIFIFYVIPLVKKNQYKNDGIVLIDKAAYLNTDILSLTADAINQKIQDKRPFYDKIFQKVASERDANPRSPVKIEQVVDASMHFLVPPDAITMPYYIKKLEGFTSLQNQDSQFIPFDIFNKRVKKEEYDDSFTDASGLTFKDRYSPEAYERRMNEFIVDHPQILTVLEKAQYMYSTMFASWDAVKSIPTLLLPDSGKIPKYSYHYSIVSWVYLQQVETNDVQTIYSFGSRPSLYYDPSESTLFVAINYNRPNQKIIYKTKTILYQRWNFIVMNYKYGTLDLFINNNLVGTYPEVLTQLDPHDILLVGSRENKNIGGICNMKYYELPLGVRKINNIYKTFHNKKIPL